MINAKLARVLQCIWHAANYGSTIITGLGKQLSSPHRSQRKREEMTFRTNDIDNTFNNPANVSAPVRHLRRRRRSAALGHRTSGFTFSGLGI